MRPDQQAASFYQRKRNRGAVLQDNPAMPAWGSILFAVNPTSGDTVTLDGTEIEFGVHVVIGDDLAETLAAFVAYATDNVPAARYSTDGHSVSVFSTTPGNDAFTLAASAATVSDSTLQLQRTRQRVPL